jgi:protein-tyrosine-phosphatase
LGIAHRIVARLPDRCIGYKDAMTDAVPSETAAVVFVCTGNRARSPLAEMLFRRARTGPGASTTSFGTLDVGPLPALPEAVDAGRLLGVDLSGHRARALRTGVLRSSSLVLGFEPFHVAAAVVDGGSDPGRTFLLRELVSLLESARSSGQRSVDEAIAEADLRRTRTRPDPTATIPDPLGQPDGVMLRTAREIEVLVTRLVSGLPLDR